MEFDVRRSRFDVEENGARQAQRHTPASWTLRSPERLVGVD
jgi:hypothetical protein